MNGVVFDADITPVLTMITNVERILAPPSLMTWLQMQAREYLWTQSAKTFATQTDPTGRAWADLEISTMMIRIREGYPPVPTNVRSGEMRAMMKSGGDVRAMGTGAEIAYPGQSRSSAKAKAKLRVAQQGGQAPGASRPTPARPVMGLTETDGAALATMFEKWLISRVV